MSRVSWLLGFALLLGACAGTPPVTAPATPEQSEPTSTPLGQPAVAEAPAPPPPPPPPPPLPPIRIAAVGDIMMGTDFPDNRLPSDDGVSTFSAVRELLRDADVSFGNLEGVLQDGGEPVKVCKDPSLCYLFRTPARYASVLQDAGFDLISLANNHARDFGEEGREASMLNLDAVGIAHSGREGDVASINMAGRQVGLVAFAPNIGSHSLLDIDDAVALVASMKESNDLVLVSFHGGAEGLDAMHVPDEMESYYGEDRGELRRFSHAVIDAGADLVLGHGPHVVRGLEVYAGRLIAYSLGNFATWQGISVAGLKGVAPVLVVDLDGEGRFIGGRIVSTRQTRVDGLQLDSRRRAFDTMADLSREDFGEHAPLFGPGDRIAPPNTATPETSE